ncbi:hypothetical protein MLA71_003393 [Salmonella enterica subsp. enterica serovar Infantis]|nr:hypothetical protein [Salmonella enterica subsp. enterica serovar Infantis]
MITYEQSEELLELIAACEDAALEEAAFKFLRDVKREKKAYDRRAATTEALLAFIEKITEE